MKKKIFFLRVRSYGQKKNILFFSICSHIFQVFPPKKKKKKKKIFFFLTKLYKGTILINNSNGKLKNKYD
jgi:hypothetical protein